MSTQARTAQRGGKNKSDSVSSTKTQKADAKSDPPKILDNPKAQPTAEQMRIAQIIDTKPDDRSLQEKIKKVKKNCNFFRLATNHFFFFFFLLGNGYNHKD